MQYQPLPKRPYWHTQQHTVLVVGITIAITGLAAFVGWGYAHIFGIIIGIASALIIQSTVWAAINRIPLWLCRPYDVRPCERPEVFHIIHNLAHHTSIPIPRVYELHTAAPNSFTFGSSPNNSIIVITSGLVQWLSNEELTGVIAHEMAHIKYRNTVFSGLGIMFSAVILGPLYFHSKRCLGWTTPHIGLNNSLRAFNQHISSTAARTTRLWMSHGCELHADAFGATVLTSPLPLISALEKIEWATQHIDFEIHPTIAPLFVVEPRNDARGIHLTERITHLRRLSRLSTSHAILQRDITPAQHP
ncbi:MAG: hypothetical protein GFH27_549327n29 [Chloroflexi bacterium AL-W]|nr:hypothetical protein [Chloroflexi bacterium AL-N1]NOK69641.1 hypothetical protein [Chloroflexi bacterium AL-N10]NOK72188.1 hypothetical protein [Chloroflexi bacterium AL-N5]NOK85017.1 hypothetical protein [Chloroflexi bacterium AL-W]NOK91770.1 hypothetical protein [Chloroflexi bacterium AL-N15]